MIRTALARTVALALSLAAAHHAAAQPFHASIGEAHYRRATNTLEFSLRLDPEDLERAVSEAAGEPIDLDDPASEAPVREYLRARFDLRAAESAAQEPRFTWVGREIADDWARLHFEYHIPDRDGRYVVTNAVLLEHAEDQTNTLNVHIDAEISTLIFTRDQRERPLPVMRGGEGVTPIQEVVTRGDGPVRLILIPGLGLTGEVWSSFMDRHLDRYTMHAVTLPGLGDTDAPPVPPVQHGAPWIENAVRAVAKLTEENGWHGAAVLGHSLGGHVAIRLGLEHGELFGPLVSFDGFPVVPLDQRPITPAERQNLILTNFVPAMMDEENRLWFFHQRMEIQDAVYDAERSRTISADFARQDPMVVAQYLLDLFRADVSEEMASLRSPLLVIAAVNDDLARSGYGTPEMRRQWQAPVDATPTATLRYLEQGDHFAFENEPERFDEMVDDFIREHAETIGD
jgi:pimeloyl-ACP methyl ester carboxylesterase